MIQEQQQKDETDTAKKMRMQSLMVLLVAIFINSSLATEDNINGDLVMMPYHSVKMLNCTFGVDEQNHIENHYNCEILNAIISEFLIYPSTEKLSRSRVIHTLHNIDLTPTVSEMLKSALDNEDVPADPGSDNEPFGTPTWYRYT